MLSQSNIKPYVSLLWLLIAGTEQSIGTIREVLRGGAGCEIKGLWRKNMSALIRSYSLIGWEKKAAVVRVDQHTHTRHTHPRASIYLHPAIKRLSVHIFSHVVLLHL